MKRCSKCGSVDFTAEGSESGDVYTCLNCGNDLFIETTSKSTYKQFEIKASYKGNKMANWSNDNFNNHMVKVTNTDTKQAITFEFWASIANPILRSEYDVLNAFYNFVSDALSGQETFESFCNEFDYDVDSRKAEKIWKACKKSADKLSKIFDGDICDLVNELSEIAG